MDDHDSLLVRALERAKKNWPDAAPQRWAAFANSVAYVMTGWSGGYGGPSVREHAASRLRHKVEPEFEEVCRAVGDSVFGPLTDLHVELLETEHCFDDDPADLGASCV